MDRDEAIKLLTGGEEGIAKWNRRRDQYEEIPRLSNANLSGADLSGANLSEVDLERGPTRRGAKLCGANLFQVGPLRGQPL